MEKNLSLTATLLLNALRNNGYLSESKCAEIVFDKPKFNPNDRTEFWQWTVNEYGHEREYQMEDDSFRMFKKTDGLNPYSQEITMAYFELRNHGLANEINSGLNSYIFYATNRG